MKKTKKPNNIYIWSAILSILSSFAVIVQNGSYTVPDAVKEATNNRLACAISQISSAFQPVSYYVLLLTALAFIAYSHLIPKINKSLLKWNIPFAFIASLFLLLCDSYYELSSWDKLFGSTTALITSGIKGIGIATMIFFACDMINRVNIEQNDTIHNSFDKKSFIRLSLIMAACWIPYMIIMAPGCMNADARDQFAQMLGNAGMSWTIGSFDYQPGNILLNNHHPVAHTVLVGIFLEFGKLIGSYFAGIELYSILQSIVFAGALTYLVVKLQEYGLSKRTAKVVYLFFAICPLFPLWGMTILKDTPFAILLLIVTLLLYDVFKAPERFNKSKYWGLAAALFLLMLIRNNGFYLVLLLLPFSVIHFRKDKKFVLKVVSVMLIPILLFKVGFTGIVFKAAGIEDGSPREMLSVPFQQTARYILEFENEITPEEEENILTVLGGDGATLSEIAESYVPDRSDNVKGLYNKYAETGDLVNYFKTWLAQLAKHPACYVEAFLNLNYSWFGFDSNHDIIYYNGVTDRYIPDYLDGFDNLKAFDGARAVLLQTIYALDKIPIVSCLFEFSFCTWCYVALFIAMLIRKKYTELLVCLPLFANYAICFVGPVAYMRYAVPMVVCLPFVIFITFSRKRSSESETKNLEDNEIWIK